jgi:hypothetical protein
MISNCKQKTTNYIQDMKIKQNKLTRANVAVVSNGFSTSFAMVELTRIEK